MNTPKQSIKFRVFDGLAQLVYDFRENTLVRLNNYFDKQASKHWKEY